MPPTTCNINIPNLDSKGSDESRTKTPPRTQHESTNGLNAGNNASPCSTSTSPGLAQIFQFSYRKNFPERLFRMLDQAAGQGLSHVIAWQPHGRCFVVRDRGAFATILPSLMPGLTQWKSFQRNLRVWGFKQLTYGPDIDGYFHQHFLRYRPRQLQYIRRMTDMGAQFSESDFYAMPPDSPARSKGLPSSDETKQTGKCTKGSVGATTARDYPKEDTASGSLPYPNDAESTELDRKLEVNASTAFVNCPRELETNCGRESRHAAGDLTPDPFPSHVYETLNPSIRADASMADRECLQRLEKAVIDRTDWLTPPCGLSQDTRASIREDVVLSHGPSAHMTLPSQILLALSRNPEEGELFSHEGDNLRVVQLDSGHEELDLNYGRGNGTQEGHVVRQFLAMEDDSSVATICSSIFSDDTGRETNGDVEPRLLPAVKLPRGVASQSFHVSIQVAQYPSFSETSPHQIKHAGAPEERQT
jgi:HSF-type DNA-binding